MNIADGLMNDLRQLGETARPFKDIILSTSFVEGAKIAVPNLVQWAIDKEHPFSQLTSQEKRAYVGRKITNVFSGRFNYAVLFVKSTLDFIVSAIKGIASAILYPLKLSSSPKEHFRQTGIALFTMLNSIGGIIEPKLGDVGFALFSYKLISHHGTQLQGQAMETFDRIRNQITNLMHHNQVPQPVV